jgi:hypothetical protein
LTLATRAVEGERIRVYPSWEEEAWVVGMSSKQSEVVVVVLLSGFPLGGERKVTLRSHLEALQEGPNVPLAGGPVPVCMHRLITIF